MASQSASSLLLQKLGARATQAWDQHKQEETTSTGGGVDLPPGISGIAQLRRIQITPIKAGKEGAGMPLFYTDALIWEPETFVDDKGNKFYPKGGLTKKSEKIFDTPKSEGAKTIKEHIDNMLKLIRGLGIKTKDLPFAALDAIFAKLTKSRPFIKFHTFTIERDPSRPVDPKYANRKPAVFHGWDGVIDYKPVKTTPTAGFNDQSATGGMQAAPEPATNGTVHSLPPLQTPNVSAPPTQDAPEVTPDASPDQMTPVDLSTATDLNEIASAAMEGNESAIFRLGELGSEAGLTEDQMSNADSYMDVAEMILQAQSSPISSESASVSTPPLVPEEPVIEESYEEEPEPEPEDKSPKAGETCAFVKYDKATKSYLPPINCVIRDVDIAAQTVSLKSLATKAVFAKVPWAKLLPAI